MYRTLCKQNKRVHRGQRELLKFSVRIIELAYGPLSEHYPKQIRQFNRSFCVVCLFVCLFSFAPADTVRMVTTSKANWHEANIFLFDRWRRPIPIDHILRVCHCVAVVIRVRGHRVGQYMHVCSPLRGRTGFPFLKRNALHNVKLEQWLIFAINPITLNVIMYFSMFRPPQQALALFVFLFCNRKL